MNQNKLEQDYYKSNSGMKHPIERINFCVDFLSGSCKLANNCPNRHLSYQLLRGELKYIHKPYKKHLCVKYQDNTCNLPHFLCLFAHGENDIWDNNSTEVAIPTRAARLQNLDQKPKNKNKKIKNMPLNLINNNNQDAINKYQQNSQLQQNQQQKKLQQKQNQMQQQQYQLIDEKKLNKKLRKLKKQQMHQKYNKDQLQQIDYQLPQAHQQKIVAQNLAPQRPLLKQQQSSDQDEAKNFNLQDQEDSIIKNFCQDVNNLQIDDHKEPDEKDNQNDNSSDYEDCDSDELEDVELENQEQLEEDDESEDYDQEANYNQQQEAENQDEDEKQGKKEKEIKTKQQELAKNQTKSQKSKQDIQNQQQLVFQQFNYLQQNLLQDANEKLQQQQQHQFFYSQSPHNQKNKKQKGKQQAIQSQQQQQLITNNNYNNNVMQNKPQQQYQNLEMQQSTLQQQQFTPQQQQLQLFATQPLEQQLFTQQIQQQQLTQQMQQQQFTTQPYQQQQQQFNSQPQQQQQQQTSIQKQLKTSSADTTGLSKKNNIQINLAINMTVYCFFFYTKIDKKLRWNNVLKDILNQAGIPIQLLNISDPVIYSKEESNNFYVSITTLRKHALQLLNIHMIKDKEKSIMFSLLPSPDVQVDFSNPIQLKTQLNQNSFEGVNKKQEIQQFYIFGTKYDKAEDSVTEYKLFSLKNIKENCKILETTVMGMINSFILKSAEDKKKSLIIGSILLGVRDDNRLLEGIISPCSMQEKFFTMLSAKLQNTTPQSSDLLQRSQYQVVLPNDDGTLFYPIIDCKVYDITIKQPKLKTLYANSNGLYSQRVEEGVWPIPAYVLFEKFKEGFITEDNFKHGLKQYDVKFFYKLTKRVEDQIALGED